LSKLSKKERSFGLKVKRIHFGTFDYTAYCVIGPFGRVKKYLRWKFEDKHFYVPKHGTGYAGLCFYQPGYVPVIWLPKKPKSVNDIAITAHEALHVVQHLFIWAGIPMNQETKEVSAHTLQYLVKQILK